MAEKIISLVVLIGIIGYLLGVALVFAFKHRGWDEKVDYIKTFKFGKWSALLIIAIPLFVIGYMSNGRDVADSIFRAFTSTFKLITLSFDFNFAITESLFIFKFTLYFCYCAVLINDLLFVASCLFQTVWTAILRWKFKRCKEEKCIVIGHDLNCKSIYKSVKKAKHHAIIVDILNEDASDELFKDKIVYKHFKDSKDPAIRENRLIEYLQKQILYYAKKHKKLSLDEAIPGLKIIVNTESVNRNLALADKITHLFSDLFINKDKKSKRSKKTQQSEISNIVKVGVKAYVFADNEHRDIFYNFETSSKGCVRFVDKHELVAQSFIQECPFAKYLTERHVDYSTGLIKKDVHINTIFIGFGKTNQQIFNSILSTFSFITKRDGNIEAKQLNYYFFDKSNTLQNKNMNSYVFRYKNDFLDPMNNINFKNYLEQPRFDYLNQCDSNSYVIDLNSSDFNQKLNKIMKKPGINVNYIIVSLGNDFETIDVVNKVASKVEQWGIKDYRIFAHIDDELIYEHEKSANNEHIIPFGCLNKYVYNFETIVDPFYEEFAMNQDSIYSGKPFKRSQGLQKWNNLELYKRYSSLYAAMSVRNKLLLMNMDIAKKKDAPQRIRLNPKQYWKIYSKGFKVVSKNKLVPKVTKYVPSLRTNFAKLEHDRWNNCMISQGFIPMSISKMIQLKTSKDFTKKEHGCITTWDQLGVLATLPNQCDTRMYDYQILDYLPLSLSKTDYVIIKKQ